ncbi:MAG TPA: hypothetical protein DER60_12765 [Syntrophomonas sp.]|jgi:drug/metabolite transporter (DMT)-like permease|nr:hypothetical protein [Syntrophomonas sp.]
MERREKSMVNFIAYIFFTVGGLFLMKLSGQPIGFILQNGVFHLDISGKMALALVMYATSFLIWTGIVANSELSFIVPFSSAIVSILSVLLGLLVFQEDLNLYKIVGIALAVSGVMLMNYQ